MGVTKMRRILLYFSLKYHGDYQLILQAIRQKEKVVKEKLQTIEEKIQSKYVTIIDKDYPEMLKHINNPPWVLYYYGDLSLLNKKTLAIIGARKNTSYGKKMCQKIIRECKDYNCNVISGLAMGIDAIAHQSAFEFQLSTIAVLGSGIDYCYPKSNIDLYNRIKAHGLLISEYPNLTKPQKQFFLVRNRLIAALSEQVVVIEASCQSGTMNTVTYALEFGKDVGCVPNLATLNSGCNQLIKQGAKLIESASDIFEEKT